MIPAVHELSIAAADAGQRLDRYLRRLLATVPLGAIFRHVRTGAIRVDGKKAKPDLRLVAGMRLQLRLPAADLSRLEAPPGPAPQTEPKPASLRHGPAPRVLYRDADVAFVDKPAGLAVQPGSGQGDVHLLGWVQREFAALTTATFQPAPAHRLDRGTSGLCAIGLSPAGLRGLAAAFRDGTAKKVYFAVVHGVPSPGSGTVDAPLRVIPGASSSGQKVEVSDGGKPARTDYEVVEAGGDRALVRLRLHSGRMHQIRAHLAHLGHPIVGDARYGSPVRLGNAFLLHAAELELVHPTRGTLLELQAPLPPAFAHLEN